jgi:signal transduction histidine kinase
MSSDRRQPRAADEALDGLLTDPADAAAHLRLEQAKDLLVQAGQALAASLDVATTFEVLSRITVPRFADWYAVHLIDENGTATVSHIAHADQEQTRQAWLAAERWSSTGGDAVVSYVLRTGKALLFPQISAELLNRAAQDAEHREALRLARLSSAMAVPLRLVDGSIIGTMMFIAAESQRTYQDDDLTIAEALANRAAMAISNARLHQQISDARLHAERAAQRFGLLVRASSAIAGSLDPDDALRRLAEFAVTALADYCITYRLDDDGSIHRIGLAHADPAQTALVRGLENAGQPRLDDAYGVGRAVRLGEPTLTPDIAPEGLVRAARSDEHLRALQALGPRSSIVVPLTARGRTLGALTFATTDFSGRRYGAADLALAEELAARLALLIDNARLYSDAAQANQAMEDMLAVVSHDLRSPLNTVMTACELLDFDLGPDQRAEIHGSIRRAAKQMHRLVEDLLDATRIEQGQLTVNLAPFDVADLLNGIVSIHAPVARIRSIALTAEIPAVPVTLRGDAARLGQALGNVIDNALRVTPAAGEVRVTVTAGADDVRISVSDTGPGIPQEHITRMFERFWRLDTSGGHGAGLGLAITKGIVDAHGGTIEVTNRPDAGACITLILPRTPHPAGESPDGAA